MQKQNPAPSHHTISIAFTLVQVIMVSGLDDFKSLLTSWLASSLLPLYRLFSTEESDPLKMCQTTSLLC